MSVSLIVSKMLNNRMCKILKRMMYADARINYQLQCMFLDQVIKQTGKAVARPFGGKTTGGVDIVIPLPGR